MTEQEIIEPEVIDPVEEHMEKKSTFRAVTLPILSGLVIDFLDVATFGPYAGPIGGLIGALAAILICYVNKVPKAFWSLIVIPAAIYCASPIPHHAMIPIATIIAILTVFKTAGDQ